MRIITLFQLPLCTLCLVASSFLVQPASAQDLEEVVSSFFDSLIPKELEEKIENMTQQVADIDFLEQIENITQQVADIDFLEMLSNITIPEELIGAVNVDVLFSEVFGGILAFFGIPGYEQYERAVDNPFYSDPVPFGSQCKFCDGEINTKKEFSGLTCEEWQIFAGFSQGEECSILRAVAVKHCDCNMWGDHAPVEFPSICPLCSNQTREKKLPELYTYVGADRVLPSLSDKLRCSDVLELPAVDGESKTCSDIGRLSKFCGCDIVVPQRQDQCTLCPPGTLPRHGEKIVLFGDEIDRSPDLTCTQLHNKFATTKDSLAGDPSCKVAHRQLSAMLGVDVRNFCGCPAKPAAWVVDPVPIEACEPCAPGYVVRPDFVVEEEGSPEQVTCRDWSEEVKTLYATDPICTALTDTVMQGCCMPIPTDSKDSFEAAASSATFTKAGSLLPFFVILANLIR